MNDRVYIDDFCYDLNYRKVILYIGSVDPAKLLEALERSNLNKTYRLHTVLNDKESQRNFMFVENCDLMDLDYPVYEYMEEGYNVYVLYEDNGRYYIKTNL